MSTDHLKKPKTQAAMARIGDIMANQIAPTFQGGALVTVIVRFPGEPECDFFMSDRAETIGELRAFLDRCDKRDQLDHTTAGVPAVAAPEVTDAMVDAYLQANDAYWKRTDELPTPPNKWRTGTPREATRESLRAALGVTVLGDHTKTDAR